MEKVKSITAHPKQWKSGQYNDMTNTILERIGNLCLVKSQSQAGGRATFYITNVFNEDGIESMPGLTITDVDKQTNEAYMRKLFADAVKKSETNRQQKIDDEIEKKRKFDAENLWYRKVDYAKSVQNSLVIELKNLTRASDDLKFYEDKSIIKILDQLSRIEQFLHHAK